MFISRRRYEAEKKEAREEGRYEAERDVWQQHRMRDMQEQIDHLTARLNRLDPEHKMPCNEEVTLRAY